VNHIKHQVENDSKKFIATMMQKDITLQTGNTDDSDDERKKFRHAMK
jgi:hypothetical protein